MKLVFDVLKNQLTQELTLETAGRIQIAAFVPYLIASNLDLGLFRFTVTKNSVEIFNKTFSPDDLMASFDETYAHIYYPIIPDGPLPMESGVYQFNLSVVGGYAATANSFLGWVKQHEDIQTPFSYPVIGDAKKPYTIRIKEYRGIHQ
jgi:hypothetical protein